jgi:CelD/BcsL family acetyltransferase involved in cellulose biosynthesis
MRDGGALVGALPLWVHRRHGLRVAEFLGGRHSALADMLVASDAPADTPARLVERALASDYDYADLFGLTGDGPLAAVAGSARLQLVERVGSPVLDLSAGFDAVYEAHTTSKRRGSNRRRLKQLEELGTVEFVRARSEDELLTALDDAFALHRLRWEGRPDLSDFASARGVAFQREAVAAIAKTNVPSILTLRLDGRAIAFHYSFTIGRSLYVHRLAFDPSLARFSPGLLTTLEALRIAAGEGVQRVEYLGGDESYKLELADRLEPMYEGIGMARTAAGHVAASLRRGSIDARKRLRSSEGARRFYYEGLAPVRRLVARARRSAA